MERVSVVVVGVMIRSLLVVGWFMIWSVSTSPRAFNSKCGMNSGLCFRLRSLKLSVSWSLAIGGRHLGGLTPRGTPHPW